MSTPRFYVAGEPLAIGARCTLPPPVAHHAVRVLRLVSGDALVLFNGAGGEYPARLVDARLGTVEVIDFNPAERESPLAITLIQALVATEKLDWVVQKTTELGVAHLLILPAERSIVRLAADRRAKRLMHWREIGVAASEQCGRTRVPTVTWLPSFDELDSVSPASPAAHALSPRLLLLPGAAPFEHSGVAATSIAPSPICVAIGPEGDWSATETAAASRQGFVAVGFGPRILRTETAGAAVVTALQIAFGDLAFNIRSNTAG